MRQKLGDQVSSNLRWVIIIAALFGLFNFITSPANAQVTPPGNGLYLPVVMQDYSTPPPAAIHTLTAGAVHTCMITQGGGVKCWGMNQSGQLGTRYGYDSSIPVDVVNLASGVIDIAAGSYHTCALLQDGTVKCWGDNQSGQIGDGTIGFLQRRWEPVVVIGLPPNIVDIAAGAFHTCALTQAGTVWCWGSNLHGQIGDSTEGYTENRATPVMVVGLAPAIRAIEVGGDRSCALTRKGGIQCWGDNNAGSGGRTDDVHSIGPEDVVTLSSGVSAVTTGFAHSCALLRSGGVKCWGLNTQGQLGIDADMNFYTYIPQDIPWLSTGWKAISSGANHTCAFSDSGIKCWGDNQFGQIGNGSTLNQHFPVSVALLTSGIQAVAVNYSHSCAMLQDAKVYCWGLNDYGQLGDGTTTDRLTPVEVIVLP